MPIDRGKNWVVTASGGKFFPADPNPSDVRIEDIAHQLSQINRFNGACLAPYSVAEHSVRVSFLVPEEHALWGLLHDSPEAYLLDLPRGVKYLPGMAYYKELEFGVQWAIAKHFNLSPQVPAVVKEVDYRLAKNEARDLLKGDHWKFVSPDKEPLPDYTVYPWGHWAITRKAFLNRYDVLMGVDPSIREGLADPRHPYENPGFAVEP